MKKIIAITVLIFLLSITAVYAETRTATIDLPAVRSDGTGVLSSMEVEIVPGKGRVLLTISPFTGIETQNSEITAVDTAKKYTDFDFSTHDVIFTINAGKSTVVDGPSAGAAMTVAVIAAAEGKEIREDGGITGTISTDGKVGKVGGILEKGKAAAEGGDKIFVIPKGDSIQPTIVEKEEEPAPGWIIKRITTEYVDISKTLKNEHGIEVIEVETIQDAIDILLNGEDTIKEKEEKEPEKLTDIEKQITTELTDPMKVLAEWEMDEAEIIREEAKENLGNPKLDPLKNSMLQDIFSDLDREISKSKQAFDKGYLYGAANYGFRAGITARYIRDIAEFYVLDEKEQMAFLGDRITETTEMVNRIKKLVEDNQHLAADSGAYEWGLSAQQRIIQAEEQLADRKESSEEILYSLSTVQSWAQISENFLVIAQELKTGNILDLFEYENKSNTAIARAEAEQGLLDEDHSYGAGWYIDVAKKEQEAEWFAASYMDASVASMRLETLKEIDTRGWSDLVSYIENELEEVNATNSAWGTLYRDYGELTLHYAKTELDVEKLKEALIYARQAKLYSELTAEYSELEEAKFGIYTGLINKSIPIIVGIGFGIVIILTFMSKSIHKSFDRKNKKKK